MNRLDFEAVFGELQQFYGDRAYNDKQASVVFRILSPLTRAQGDSVVQTLVETCARTPTPAQVKQAALAYIRLAEQAKQQAAVKEIGADTCRVCGGTGLMLALAKTDPTAEYSFACPHCESASIRKIRTIPVWSDDRSGEFVKVSLKSDSHVGAKQLQERHRIPRVRAAWVERLKKHPWALAKLRKAQRGLPDYLLDLVREERGAEDGGEEREREADGSSDRRDTRGAPGAHKLSLPRVRAHEKPPAKDHPRPEVVASERGDAHGDGREGRGEGEDHEAEGRASDGGERW